MSQMAHNDQEPLFELRTVLAVAHGSFGIAPDGRHRLQVLGLRPREELLHRGGR